MRYAITFFVALSTIALSGCETGLKSSAGFRLPDGDPEQGREAFVALECNSCHTIKSMTLPVAASPGPVTIELGGDVRHVKSYGELVTSVINPSHVIARKYSKPEVAPEGESLMRIYNDVMTVRQLIDLVAFLQPTYNVVVPELEYRMYTYD